MPLMGGGGGRTDGDGVGEVVVPMVLFPHSGRYIPRKYVAS